jgi:NitT/TauT family transport system permease protein/taurine transport system permease protein/sulfonate transport system permease protein
MGIILVGWEVAAHILKLFTPYASTILPPLEHIIRVSIPGFAVYYGIGMPGAYGQESSFLFAFLVIVYHSAFTFFRVIAGTLLGASLGIMMGLLVFWSLSLGKLLLPPLLFIRTIPNMVFIPLFITWFGGKEIGVLLFMALSVFVFLFVNTIEAVRNVYSIYQNYARTLGANRAQLFRTVIVPAIVPELSGGIRVVLGLAWAMSLAAEYLVTQQGLGRMMILSEQHMYTGRMLIIAFLYIIYSISLNKLYLKISNYFTRWVPRVEQIPEAERG